MFTIAIVGRPNVGKSTLFNKLVGKPIAIVNDYAGVTRDRKEAIGNIGPMEFRVIDTAGWSINDGKKEYEKKMVEQTEVAIKEADLCLFVVDYRSGITEIDLTFAEHLRKIKTPVILLANKYDTNKEPIFDKEVEEQILNPNKNVNPNALVNNETDELLPLALKAAIDCGQASATMIRRKFAIGYPRAARIIDQMEAAGYISTADGVKGRTVYTTEEEFREIFGDQYD